MSPQAAPSPRDLVKPTAQQPLERARLCREPRFQAGFLSAGVFPHRCAASGLVTARLWQDSARRHANSLQVSTPWAPSLFPTLRRLILTPDFNKRADFFQLGLSPEQLQLQRCVLNVVSAAGPSPEPGIGTNPTAPTHPLQRAFLDNNLDPSLSSLAFHPLWDLWGEGTSPTALQTPRGRNRKKGRKKEQYPRLIDAGSVGISIFCN